jgi:Arc/MetJ family transcription regulator
MRKPDKRQSYEIDAATMKQAQKILGTKTEAETIHKALELVTNEVRLAQALKHLLDKGKGHLHDPTSAR